MHFVSTVAVFSAVVASAQAAKAIINNHCSEAVYLWPVDTERNPSTPTKLEAGKSWSEPYYQPKSGGVSIKISRTSVCQKVTQFEYTLASGNIWYDGSNIDCSGKDCPFNGYNMLIKTSSPSCPQRACDKNDAICTGFYNAPDDIATLSCPQQYDAILDLCLPDAQMPGASSSGSATQSAVGAASPAVTSAAVQTNEAPKVTTTLVTTTQKARQTRSARAVPIMARAVRYHAHAHVAKV